MEGGGELKSPRCPNALGNSHCCRVCYPEGLSHLEEAKLLTALPTAPPALCAGESSSLSGLSSVSPSPSFACRPSKPPIRELQTLEAGRLLAPSHKPSGSWDTAVSTHAGCPAPGILGDRVGGKCVVKYMNSGPLGMEARAGLQGRGIESFSRGTLHWMLLRPVPTGRAPRAAVLARLAQELRWEDSTTGGVGGKNRGAGPGAFPL